MTAIEIQNRFRVASKIATTIEAFTKPRFMDAEEVARDLPSDGWQMFATKAGCDPEYMPSEETRLFVKEILRDHAQKACTDCGVRQASRESTPQGKPGTEVCDYCWSRAGITAEA